MNQNRKSKFLRHILLFAMYNILSTAKQPTVKHFYSQGLYFRVNSWTHIDEKIKSSPIISYVKIIEEDLLHRENKISWINHGWWPRENKVTRIISDLQYSRSGDNQLWILKDSEEIFEHLKSPYLNHLTITDLDLITEFDFLPNFTRFP